MEDVKRQVRKYEQGKYVIQRSLLDPREDFDLEKAFFLTCICIFIDVSCSDLEGKCKVTRLLTRRVVIEPFVQERKYENLKLSGLGNEVKE